MIQPLRRIHLKVWIGVTAVLISMAWASIKVIPYYPMEKWIKQKASK